MKHSYELIDNNFLTSIADVMETGVKGNRTADGWKKIDWDDERESHYLGRIMSHIVKTENAPHHDKERHCASIAANAMIIAWHSRMHKEPDTIACNDTGCEVTESTPIYIDDYGDIKETFPRMTIEGFMNTRIEPMGNEVARTIPPVGPEERRLTDFTGLLDNPIAKGLEMHTAARPWASLHVPMKRVKTHFSLVPDIFSLTPQIDFEKTDLMGVEPESYKKELKK